MNHLFTFYVFAIFTIIGSYTQAVFNPANAQKIDVNIQDEAAYFVEGKDSILSYQIAEKSFNGTYPRSNYIHPLYTLDGQVLTEDFPPDHLHHRGIFWAWHQLYIGEKRLGDPWEIKNFHWDITSVKVLKGKGKAKALRTEVLWKTNQWVDADGKEKAVVSEISTIKVYPIKNNYRQIDMEISIRALEKNMRLGGSEDEKGYGGFSPRIRLTEDIQFTGPEGKVIPKNLPVKASEWLDISGSLGTGGALAGLSILCHPDNPGFPNPWILRAKNSMQNAVYPFPGAKAVPLSQTQPTVLRYRLLVHQGKLEASEIAVIHAEYGKR